MKSSIELYSEVSQYLVNQDYLISQLQLRYKNNEEVNSMMNYKDLIGISKVDEYFYRQMSENVPRTYGSALNTYLYEIEREIVNQPLLLLSLPLYQLDEKTLRKYINYDNIINRINQLNNEVNKIYKKITKNYYIVDNELEKILLFFIYCIPYEFEFIADASEQLAKYLLNNPRSGKHINYYITVFLIKFFGYKKIIEEGLTETQLLIAEMQNNTLGLSTENFAVVNKRSLQNVITSNNRLDSMYGDVGNDGKELLAVLQTMYHELRHQKQSANAKAGIKDDISYFMAARNIIYDTDQSDYDYNINYRSYEIEKDANYEGWKCIEELIKTYMPTKNLSITVKNILKYKLNEELEQITGTRKNKNNQTYTSSELLISYLDQIFRRNPSPVRNEYPQFQEFYNYNGEPKKVVELLTKKQMYSYKEFYFAQISNHYQSPTCSLTNRDIYYLSTKEKQAAINNIKILMSIANQKITKIRDRIDRGSESKDNVRNNLIKYHSFASYLSNVVRNILAYEPQLITLLSVKNAIDSINENIDMINNNRLVRNIIDGRNMISKVGRR